jgi:hypothetical protein
MEIVQDSQQSFRSTPVGFDHKRAELGDRRGDRRQLTTTGEPLSVGGRHHPRFRRSPPALQVAQHRPSGERALTERRRHARVCVRDDVASREDAGMRGVQVAVDHDRPGAV